MALSGNQFLQPHISLYLRDACCELQPLFLCRDVLGIIFSFLVIREVTTCQKFVTQVWTINGRKFGEFQTIRRKTGLVHESGMYDRGYRHGLWKRYHRNGRLKEIGVYLLDLKEGVWINYDSKGDITTSVTYYRDCKVPKHRKRRKITPPDTGTNFGISNLFAFLFKAYKREV